MLNIEKKTDGNALTVVLSGRLDTTTAPELEKQLKDSMGAIEALVIDMETLEYISSAGIRQVVAAHKLAGGNLLVRNASPEVREVLRLTGIDKRMDIE